MVVFLKEIALELGKPSSILVISAHWEESVPTLLGAARPDMLYDYYGFPEESYEFQYPAPGNPGLAGDIRQLIATAGFDVSVNSERGYDHGLFIPMMLMYPEADIPCVQLSLTSDLDPVKHLELGKALSDLRKRDVLIIGSGLSYHNMAGFGDSSETARSANLEFDHWLVDTCAGENYSAEQREGRLSAWETAPSARQCHPREEHLLPLHVCYGAAMKETPQARVVFNDDVLGRLATGLLW